jgi:UBX domain-containing protein 7
MADEEIASFVAFTGTTDDVARQILEITGGDLGQAATLYFDNPESWDALPSTLDMASSSAAQPPADRPPPIPMSTRPEVINLDSDDDEDIQMLDEDFSDVLASEAQTVARSAQEEEDAAMAKRLQEELYSENAQTADGIRAPIARTTETLLAPEYGAGAIEDDDDAIARHLEQLARRRHAQGKWASQVLQPDMVTKSSC